MPLSERSFPGCGLARALAGTLTLAALTAAVVAQAGDTALDRAARYSRAESASLQAFKDGDFRAMEEALETLLELRPGNPQVRYQWAAVQALSGDAERALQALESLADEGLSFQPDREPAFETLWTLERFQAVLARLRNHGLPSGSARPVHSVDQPRWVPEGLAYDPRSGALYLGSVRERRVLRIDRDGRQQPFVASGEGGLWSALGMTVDLKRGWLWVASSAFPEMIDYDPILEGRAALFAYRLDDASLAARHELPRDGVLHALGDVQLGPDGRLYASDSAAGQLWALSPETGRWEALAPAGLLASPQGLSFSADAGGLWLADYGQGLFRYDLGSREWQRLIPPAAANLYGIDGLARHGDALIAVQNGIRPHRVIRITPDPTGGLSRVEVLVQALPEFDEPTLGAVVGDEFLFVANSHWNRFDARHQLETGADLSGPLIMAVGLARP